MKPLPVVYRGMLLLSILALASLSTMVSAQGEWSRQVSGTTNVLRAVYFINDETGWVVGYSGAIHHTTDGGTTWTQQTSGTTNALYSVYFLDAKNGWAVGGNGTILSTSNAGIDWNQQSTGESNTLRSIYFIDPNTGWIVGRNDDFSYSLLYRTTNGGTEWLERSSPGESLWSLSFSGAQEGWSVGSYATASRAESFVQGSVIDVRTNEVLGGSAMLLHTRDGFLSFELSINYGVLAFHDLDFVDVDNGWIVGFQFNNQSAIAHTTDGGIDWTTQLSETAGLWSVHFTDANVGWAVGEDGTIIHTTDGGMLWASQTSGTTNDLFSVHLTNANTGWAVGTGGTILHYSSGGTSVSVVATVSPTSGDGSFDYTLDLTNNTDSPQSVDLWAMILGPSGFHKVKHVFYGKQLSPHEARSETRTRQLGADAPLGEYSLITYVGTYPDDVIDSSSASYTKTMLQKGSLTEGKAIPEAFEVSDNYPDPFNPTTTIRYTLSEDAHVTLKVYNILGQLVATLVDENQLAGYQRVVWNGRNDSGSGVASGLYIYRITAGTFTATKRMLFLK